MNKRLKDLKYNSDTTLTSDHVSGASDLHNYIKIPYIRGLSEHVCFTLRKCDFKVVYFIPKRLDKIIRKGKDKVGVNKRMDVMYKIDCTDCNKFYIG